MVSAIFIVLLIIVAIAAPLIVDIFGLPGPDVNDSNALDAFGPAHPGTLAACQIPLTREEVELQLPAALTAAQASSST